MALAFPLQPAVRLAMSMKKLKRQLRDVNRQAVLGELDGQTIYKLNELLFEWEGDDGEGKIPTKLAEKIFSTTVAIRQAYIDLHQKAVREKSDDELRNGKFFYDYLALLGTMCNQYCWTNSHRCQLLNFMREVALDIPVEEGGSNGKRRTHRESNGSGKPGKMGTRKPCADTWSWSWWEDLPGRGDTWSWSWGSDLPGRGGPDTTWEVEGDWREDTNNEGDDWTSVGVQPCSDPPAVWAGTQLQ